jgi:hypothetical protein
MILPFLKNRTARNVHLPSHMRDIDFVDTLFDSSCYPQNVYNREYARF